MTRDPNVPLESTEAVQTAAAPSASVSTATAGGNEPRPDNVKRPLFPAPTVVDVSVDPRSATQATVTPTTTLRDDHDHDDQRSPTVDSPSTAEGGKMATVDPARGVGAGSPGADELTRGEVNLVARSIRERWPTHPRIKEAILTKVARVGLKSENPRIVFSAFRCIAMAERQNQLDQHRAQPEVVAHVHLGAEAREAVRDLSVEELRIMRRIRMRVVGGAGAGGGDEADAGTEAGLDGIEEALEREQERKGKR